MQISGFEWSEWNIEHIAKHSVTPQEVEEACFNQPISRKAKDGLYIIYGQTDAGRYMFIVVRYQAENVVYVVTARTMNKTEQQYYRKQR